MVFYKCEKCNKEFNQKSNYLSHINRKNSCISKNNNDDDNINVILYKCEKCNKEFNQKFNYISHINKKKSCNINDNDNTNDNDNDNTNDNTNIILYKCEKCNKEFNKKSNYLSHINKKNPCNSNDLIQENKILLDKIKKFENVQTINTQLENEIEQLKQINQELKIENNKINELLEKCITNKNNIITNTNTNIINNTNNTNNIIKIKLVNFGQEKYTKLTKEEKQHILKYSKQSMANLIKYLHINDRIPEYKNVCVKNLRGKGGYLYEDNKWMHLNYNILLMILFKNKINDLDKILAENENLNISSSKNIQGLIDNYTDDMDTFIKNNKENIINMLYNHTKNYKIE